MKPFIRMIGKILHAWDSNGKHYQARQGEKIHVENGKVSVRKIKKVR